MLIFLSFSYSQARAFVILESSLNKGGAFYMSGVNVFINADRNINMRGNNATYGGVFYFGDNSQIEIKSDMTIESNSATYGGVFTGSGSFAISGSGRVTCFSNNATSGDGGDFAYISGGSVNFGGNFSSSGGRGTNGGAMYISGATVNFNGELILTDNEATSQGGAIYITGGNTYFNNGADVSITQNKALCYGRSGGGIFVDSSQNFVINSGAKLDVSSNIAQDGGGLYIYLVKNLLFAGGEFTVNNNKAQYHNISSGGAMEIDGVNIFFSGTKIVISNNTSIIGGAIWMNANNIYFNGGSFLLKNNKANSQGGGIVFVNCNFHSTIPNFTCASGSTGNTPGDNWRNCSGINITSYYNKP